MRKLGIGVFFLLILGLAAGFGTDLGSDQGQARATLRLVRHAPLTVRGDHFRAGERVRLRTNVSRVAKRAIANAKGSFVTSFGTPTTRCDLIRVEAVRSPNGTVVLKQLPSPACSPA